MLVQCLEEFGAKWLKPTERPSVELFKAIILQQLIWDLKEQAQKWVRQHQPEALEEAVHITEAFVGASEKTACDRVTWVEPKGLAHPLGWLG